MSLANNHSTEHSNRLEPSFDGAAFKPMHQNRGFTLLEMLVALAVFAVVAAVAYAGLDRMSTQKAHLDREMRFWRELGLVMDRMESDFVQIAPRQDLMPSGWLRPPVFSASQPGDPLINLTRFDGKREPVRLGYRLQAQSLALVVWEAQKPQVYPLLENVTACHFSYMNSSGKWQSIWSGSEGTLRPQGIRIELEVAGHGKFERIVAIP